MVLLQKSIASQATFLNTTTPTAGQATVASVSSVTSKPVTVPVSQAPPPATTAPILVVSAPVVPSGSSGKKDLAIQSILNSQPKLAPKPVSGDLELLGPHVGSMSNQEAVLPSGVKSGTAVAPTLKSYVLRVSMPGQNGVSSAHTTVVSAQNRPLPHTYTSSTNQVIVTEQDKQQRLLEQQQKFRSQVDKLQRIWSQRSQQSDASLNKEKVPAADQKPTKSPEPDRVTDVTLESWKQDKDVALVKTRNHAKAVAKHSEEVR